MVNKRGQDLSIGTLILIVLGIIVLVLLILGFSMGWSNLWEKIGIFGGTSSVGDVVTACKLAVTSQDSYAVCQKSWKVKVNNEKQVLYCRHNLVQLDEPISGCTASQDLALFTALCSDKEGTVENTPCVAPAVTVGDLGFSVTGKDCCKATATP